MKQLNCRATTKFHILTSFWMQANHKPKYILFFIGLIAVYLFLYIWHILWCAFLLQFLNLVCLYTSTFSLTCFFITFWTKIPSIPRREFYFQNLKTVFLSFFIDFFFLFSCLFKYCRVFLELTLNFSCIKNKNDTENSFIKK